jgi:hypothetical protein
MYFISSQHGIITATTIFNVQGHTKNHCPPLQPKFTSAYRENFYNLSRLRRTIYAYTYAYLPAILTSYVRPLTLETQICVP